ncbi:hypothetical protein [Polymorphospora rubra]|uniref:hypothetical protein n=1 Tax=Polymorphospora rubra TaxID=338584 RepID=UPI0033F9541E
MTTTQSSGSRAKSLIATINGPWHQRVLALYMIIVVAHWGEHIAQAVQIWGFGWTAPEARGLLGMPFPWLIQQEWLHYAYALVMLIGLAVLLPGFQGRARTWWRISLIIQVWHHFEHLLLLIQSLTGAHLLGSATPVSIAQLVVPRVELHLFYNAIVFLPMIVAMYLHVRPTRAEAAKMTCRCAPARTAAALAR